MTDPRALLDAYSRDGDWSREAFAAKAFAALRAVLAECDREDSESIGIVSTDTIRAAITNALEAR